MDIKAHIQQIAQQAKAAAEKMRENTAEARQSALFMMADQISAQSDAILAANAKDIEQGKANQLSPALLDRLSLTPARIDAMVTGMREIAKQPDPIGSIRALHTVPSGFKVGKMRTPIGVIGIIYESRPNVTADAAAICLKSGNACILRGGSEAFHSNQAIIHCIQTALANSALDNHIIQYIDTTDRQAVNEMLNAVGLIDVVIPRGGKGLVKVISEQAKIPVIKHLDGICHVYIDEYADSDKAIAVAFNAKTYRYGICGAMETLLVHQKQQDQVLPTLIDKFHAAGVSLVADATTAQSFGLMTADEIDWHTEYLDAKLSIRVVNDIDTAIQHINTYGSHHTDAIVTEHIGQQNQFLNRVDSASVMVNTPTCFADGFEYGLGAEIGISTDKLHVRGPVGVADLTTEKYIILGNGETR